MIRRPPRSTHCISSAASDVYKRQKILCLERGKCFCISIIITKERQITMKQEKFPQCRRAVKKTFDCLPKQTGSLQDGSDSCYTKASEGSSCENKMPKDSVPVLLLQIKHSKREDREARIRLKNRNTESTVDSESDEESDISQKKCKRGDIKRREIPVGKNKNLGILQTLIE
eukprot:TRINITY_DN7031_c0_g1_i10.p1 TRINITY_DN7031_c0_g1~~TRINITY_DN7031_c0_g1_i10.p1  ORF type:complete len:179 (-),score=29.48 TRINITY_DN7031_c0_g1_i10:432-947(-)